MSLIETGTPRSGLFTGATVDQYLHRSLGGFRRLVRRDSYECGERGVKLLDPFEGVLGNLGR